MNTMIHLTKIIKNQLFGGHARTSKANKNVLFSFLIKGSSIACQFALVPLTLHYLDKDRYGIWLTVASLLGWLTFFDIGVGNGLRNKLSEALANKDVRMARIYVSTSYALVGAIFLSLMVVLWIICPFINWSRVLNAPPAMSGELLRVVLVVFSFFCIQFILQLIGNILFAHQEPAFSNLINPLASVLSLTVIFIMTRTVPASLFWVSVVFSVSPVIMFLTFNIIFLGKRYREIAPSFKYVQFRHSKDLFGLGLQFFIIQIAAMVLYSSSNIILVQLFGPEDVTIYNIAYKYFTIALMINGIITATYWSAFTDAYVRNEFDWIKKTIKRMEKVTYLLMGLVIVSTLLANWVFYIWLGGTIKIPYTIQIVMCIYALISLIAAPQHIFLNGTGKIRLQLYSAVVTIIITIPMAILFCKVLKIGPAGVILAMICTTLPVTILYKIQYDKIISGRAKGIWNQ
ncbi:MAG TPA: MATE family efflux transporter [Puia sp.]|nr:MATE family efflux transporter [Puia sp.]